MHGVQSHAHFGLLSLSEPGAAAELHHLGLKGLVDRGAQVWRGDLVKLCVAEESRHTST